MIESVKKVERGRGRDYSLDLVKVLATIIIIFHHYQQTFGIHFENGINFFGGTFYFGWVTELFFLLSGLFMFPYIAKILNNTSFANFIAKRWVRLFPLLLLGAVVQEIIFIILNGSNPYYGITFWGTIINALGIQDGWVFANPYVNNPTWFVSVLLLCYCIFYLALFLSKKINIPYYYLFAFIILMGIGIRTYDINLPFLNSSSARGFYAFFFGLLLARYIENKEFSAKHTAVCFLILTSIIMLIEYYPSFMESGINYTLTFIFYPALIVFCKSKPINKLLNQTIFGFLGRISFDVYIWHGPIIFSTLVLINYEILQINLSSYSAMVIFVVICFLIGTLSFFFVELPLNKKLNDVLNKKSWYKN